ncbi:MAG: DUF2975 domain-containing protein [Clostridium lundense]|nr:DUF2975 domain-containing protein [Clostridium lundense]
MKQRTTFLLKLAIFVIVIPILSLFIFILPRIMSGLAEVIPVPAYLQYPGLIALHAAWIPFLFALYHTIRLLININRDKAFSKVSVKALKNIKCSAITICGLYVISMPLLFLLADGDDAPGIILFALLVIFAMVMSSVFAASLEKRYHSNKIS